ncbi:MAG: T9SS type A sorting domain-containing protein [Saprospiraceae bacterium]|nr:T9SS type A sorting domain-containing protein [Candidatus Defluviibacterium haderslevense]
MSDNILCYFIHRETATRLDPAPLWSSWIMIKGEDLGLLTTNKDLSTEQENLLKISPNPTSDILTIEFDKVISGKLYIYNEIGHLIRSEDLYDVKEYKYNVSEFLDGKYHIQFIDDNKIFNAQFIKVK